MDIHLSIEQEAQLMQIAALEGKGPEELAHEVLRDALSAKAARHGDRRESTLGSKRARAEELIARMLEQRRGNLLPDGVTIRDLICEGRA